MYDPGVVYCGCTGLGVAYWMYGRGVYRGCMITGWCNGCMVLAGVVYRGCRHLS